MDEEIKPAQPATEAAVAHAERSPVWRDDPGKVRRHEALIALSAACKGDWGKMSHAMDARMDAGKYLRKKASEKANRECLTDTLAFVDRDYPEGWWSLFPMLPYLIYAKGNRSILSSPRQSVLAVACSSLADRRSILRAGDLLDDAMKLSPNLVLAADVDSSPWNDWFLARAAQAGHRIVAVTETGVPRWAKESPALWQACKEGKGILVSEYPANQRRKSAASSAMASRLVTGLSGGLLVPFAIDREGPESSPESGVIFGALGAGIPVWCLNDSKTSRFFAFDAALIREGKAKIPADAGEILAGMAKARETQAETSEEPEQEA